MRMLIIPGLLLTSLAFAADAAPVEKVKPYPLATCPISGEKLGGMGEFVTKEYQGQEVKFCCKSCPRKFEKDIPGNLEKINQQAKDQAAKSVPEAKHDH